MRSAAIRLTRWLRAHHGLERRPLGLELLLLLLLLALGDFVEFVIQLGHHRRVEVQLRHARFVVDGHRRAVVDRLLDVVDADVVAKDGAGVLVGQLNRRAGEADEGGVGQRIVDVAGEAIHKIVLAAVRLVGNHNDVAARR